MDKREQFEFERTMQWWKEYDAIVFGLQGDDNCFQVIPMEASLGKTTVMAQSLAVEHAKKPDLKSLVVTLFQEEKDGNESNLSQRINEYAGQKIAISIDYRNKDEYIEKLDQYPIVIITHEQYRRLCKYQYDRNKFTKGRKNLIIDEELQLLDTNKLTQKDIADMKAFLEFSRSTLKNIQNQFAEFVQEIELAMARTINDGFRFVFIEYNKGSLQNSLNSLYKLCEQNIDEKQIEQFKEHYKYGFLFNTKKANVTKDTVLNKLKYIAKFYNNPNVIISRQKLYTYNYYIKPFRLKNNIILDASAKFNSIYKFSNEYHVIDMPRIRDFSRTHVYVSNLNTTASAKESKKMTYYYECLINYIKQKCTKDDKVLIVGSKDEIEEIEKTYPDILGIQEHIKMVNFWKLRGKNDWKDFNKCFIIHTPNMDYASYIFLYQLYSGERLNDDDLKTTFNEYGNFSFVNEDLEETRQSYLASHVYQAITRINRDNKLDAEVYIMMSDQKVVNIVKEQLTKRKMGEFNFELKVPPRKKYNNSNRFKKSSAYKFINFVTIHPIGGNEIVFTKREVCEIIEFNKHDDFGEEITQKAIAYLKQNNSCLIEYEGKIIILTFQDRVVRIENKQIVIKQI